MSDSETRHRQPGGQGSESEAVSGDEKSASGGPDLAASKSMPQGTDSTPSILKSTIEVLPPRWRNWVIRGIFSWIMIFGFSFIVYLGPLALLLLVVCIQLLCFHEIIKIGYIVYKSQDLPWFRTLSWYFLFASNYFFFGESLVGNFRIALAKEEFLQPLLTYHRFISFCLYCGGVVAFVMSLVKKHYLQQFTLFGWTHVTLLIVVTSSHFIMNNIFNGLIWFLVPVSMIICNDIMAYVFGFFFGKTPLIKLSPKKTWEGFIGGGVSTIIFSIILSNVLINFDHFVCPIEYDDVKGQLTMECIRNRVFKPAHFELFRWMSFTWYPFFGHCTVLAIFASVVGPFGGFFASGFKRAFKIKDFGDIIPGHGGMMDRFDCQVLMGAFVFVYYQSFIKLTSPNALLQQIYMMRPNEQLEFHELLTAGLLRRGILNSTLT